MEELKHQRDLEQSPLEQKRKKNSNVHGVVASINCQLLENQKEGVKFLYKLHKNNHGGILGDDIFDPDMALLLAFVILSELIEVGSDRWAGNLLKTCSPWSWMDYMPRMHLFTWTATLWVMVLSAWDYKLLDTSMQLSAYRIGQISQF